MLFEPERIRELLRTALAMLDDTTDRLAASRVYAMVASVPHYPSDVISYEEAAARAVSLAGSTPSRERVDARLASAYAAQWRLRYAWVLDELGLARAARAELGDHSDPPEYRWLDSTGQWYLGRAAEAIESARGASRQFARNGDPGAALDAATEVAWMLIQSGNLDEGIALDRSLRAEAEHAGLPVKAAMCAYDEALALVQLGQLHAARAIFEEIRSRGLLEFRYHILGTAVFLALGDIEEAWEHDGQTIATYADRAFMPNEELAIRRAAILGALGDSAAEADWADRFLVAVADSDSPVLAAAGAYLGLRVPEMARSADLTERALGALERGRALRAPGDCSWYSAYQVYAEALAARLDGRRALEEWAEGVDLANRFGAYFGLQPRLELAVEHLRAGDRATGKEQLVSVWADAREMGAGWYERRAAALATRNRVPLPSAQEEAAGPLHRLTAREREVLELLADGATDREIAATLVISPRTASIHVGNILAKLDVPNRGAAAPLARTLG